MGSLEEISQSEELECYQQEFTQEVLEEVDLRQLEIATNCSFKEVSFINCQMEKLEVIDSTFTNCDFSNFDLSKSYFNRVSFVDCKIFRNKATSG